MIALTGAYCRVTTMDMEAPLLGAALGPLVFPARAGSGQPTESGANRASGSR